MVQAILFAVGVALWAGQASALTAVDPPYGALSVSGNYLVGSSGKQVQLRGMSLFWSQWMGQFFTADVVKALKCQWNANAVRAAMGVDQGGYLSAKDTELAKVRAVVESSIEAGIYVIIDWHIHEAQNYKAEAIAFFQQMATDYGKYPHVIYELWNEPLQVDWNSVIKPFHVDVLAAIRAIDADNVALLGTPSWSGASGITDASNSPLTGQKNIMYVQHFYSGTHKDYERSALQSAAAKIPVFVSEYGISEADGGSNGQIYTEEANKWFTLMDSLKVSYLNWAVDDKSEASAALIPGTDPTKVGDGSVLSAAGKFIKAMLKSKDNGVSCSGSSSGSASTAATTKAPSASTAATTKAAGAASTSAASTAAPSSGSGSVSVNVQTVNSWSGGAQININVVNGGSSKICSVTLKLTKESSTTVQSLWNLDSSDGVNYSTPSWVTLTSGQTHTAGAVIAGNVPSFSVTGSKTC